MFTFISRSFIRPVVLACVVFAGTNAALAQTPQSTPRPTSPPGDPTRPPGNEPIPGTTTPTQNPAAPPAAPVTNPAAPPGTIPTQRPAQTNPTTAPGTVPTQTPADPTATPVPGAPQEPLREPVIPNFQPKPLPPVPSLTRLGVGSETLPLSLNDAIKRALENNNDIEVARDDVRFAETQLRALEGIFDPVFAITPTYDKRISPETSSLSGSGQSGTTSTTTYTFSPAVQKQFGT